MRRDDVRFSTYNRFCRVVFKVSIMVLDNQLTKLSVTNVMDMELTARLENNVSVIANTGTIICRKVIKEKEKQTNKQKQKTKTNKKQKTKYQT